MTQQKGLTVYDRIYPHLFEPKSKSGLSEQEEWVRKRFLLAYNLKLDDPLKPDKEVAQELQDQFNISRSLAYLDIANVERLFGSFKKSHKEYIRHIVTETQKEVISHELKRIRQDPTVSSKTLSYAVKVLAEANNLDKEDMQDLPYDKLQPPIPEISDDVTVSDLDNIDEASIEKLRKKYMSLVKKESQDVEVINDNE
ncbi:MAG: hypothetical protein V5A47_11015 [Bacteroidales bacterium]